MDEVETEFLKTQERMPLAWFRYIDDIFFICNHGEEYLEKFLQELHNSNPDLKFTYKSNEKEIYLYLSIYIYIYLSIYLSISISIHTHTHTHIYIYM